MLHKKRIALTEDNKEFILDNANVMNMKQLSEKLGLNYCMLKTYCRRNDIKCKDYKRGLSTGAKKAVDMDESKPMLFIDDLWMNYDKGQMIFS